MVVGDTPAAATQLSAPKTQPLHSGMDFLLILDAVSIIQEINPGDLQPLGKKKKKKNQNQLPLSQELVTVLSSKQAQAHVPQFTSGFPFGWAMLNRRSHSWLIISTREPHFGWKLKYQAPTNVSFLDLEAPKNTHTSVPTGHCLAFENSLLVSFLLSISTHPWPKLQFLPSPVKRSQTKEKQRRAGVLQVPYNLLQAETNF